MRKMVARPSSAARVGAAPPLANGAVNAAGQDFCRQARRGASALDDRRWSLSRLSGLAHHFRRVGTWVPVTELRRDDRQDRRTDHCRPLEPEAVRGEVHSFDPPPVKLEMTPALPRSPATGSSMQPTRRGTDSRPWRDAQDVRLWHEAMSLAERLAARPAPLRPRVARGWAALLHDLLQWLRLVFSRLTRKLSSTGDRPEEASVVVQMFRGGGRRARVEKQPPPLWLFRLYMGWFKSRGRL